MMVAAFTLACLWFATEAPRVDGHFCAAPWRVVLAEAHDVPSAGTDAAAVDIAGQCRSTGYVRFAIASVSGLAALSAMTRLSLRIDERPRS